MNGQDKYVMFRNFMFNELKISKEDIRIWIREAVQEQVIQTINNSHGKLDVVNVVNKELENILNNKYGSKREFYTIVAQEIANKINISYK